MSIMFGSKLKQIRKSKGFSLEKLAQLTCSSKSYIWELEKNNALRPSAKKVLKIAEQLGVTVEYIMDDEEIIKIEDATDAHFYRKYQQMNEKTKAKIRSLVDILYEDDIE